MRLFAVWVVMIFFLVVTFSGCALRDPGRRTFQFGPDGTTITSETTEGSSTSLADIEKEKTRQVCYKQQATKRDRMEKMAESNPMVLALIHQTEAINNLASLAVTKKPYDPCPSSTNSSDVEIADAAMYSSIYHDAFDFAKFGLGVWAGVEISDNLFSALSKGAGYTFSALGDGSSINVTDAFKSSVFRDGATTGALFSNPVDNTAPPFVFGVEQAAAAAVQ
jgi:hypothetical protein